MIVIHIYRPKDRFDTTGRISVLSEGNLKRQNKTKTMWITLAHPNKIRPGGEDRCGRQVC